MINNRRTELEPLCKRTLPLTMGRKEWRHTSYVRYQLSFHRESLSLRCDGHHINSESISYNRPTGQIAIRLSHQGPKCEQECITFIYRIPAFKPEAALDSTEDGNVELLRVEANRFHTAGRFNPTPAQEPVSSMITTNFTYLGCLTEQYPTEIPLEQFIGELEENGVYFFDSRDKVRLGLPICETATEQVSER